MTSEEIRNLQEQFNIMTSERVASGKKLHRLAINEDYFKGDDEKVTFYTGLVGFSDLMKLFKLIKKDVYVNHSSSLTGFQQMILTLMKLRLNLSVQDLATFSRTFLKILDILYSNMSWLVKWPSREELWHSMPMSFRKLYGNKVAVIIDCFEVFLDRPSNLLAQAQTWSSYKHHNTVKFFYWDNSSGMCFFHFQGMGR